MEGKHQSNVYSDTLQNSYFNAFSMAETVRVHKILKELDDNPQWLTRNEAEFTSVILDAKKDEVGWLPRLEQVDTPH